ncbi:TPMT [Acanthosepion pharaonis]|uniref:thiopurine S-methyltransferase n=1 Tax=Acanthosepion pharaonis TaxID=158019 RepID=A0A812CAB6_ACAPH|nr:TPMT [Sepia pharaonis]
MLAENGRQWKSDSTPCTCCSGGFAQGSTVGYHVNVKERKVKMSENKTHEYWINKWLEGKTSFHSEKMHISLEKHLDKFIAGRTGIKMFFPLCGKTVDMRLLADQGHYVVGVDIAEQAFQEFFIDQNLEYTEEPLKNVDGKLFKSMDGRIKLYCMDFYLFTKEMEGQFNAIWDRGSLVAINIEDRIKYSQLIQEVMSPDCKYMVAAMQYDTSEYTGPPYNILKIFKYPVTR